MPFYRIKEDQVAPASQKKAEAALSFTNKQLNGNQIWVGRAALLAMDREDNMRWRDHWV